jgi:hypothetical protein
MSDPAWASRTLVDGHNGRLFVQDAGVTATPGTADELGWVESIDFSYEADVSEVGPFLNLATIAKTISSYNASGSVSVRVADGADTVRNKFFTAMSAKTRLKLTYVMDEPNGEEHAFDQSIIGFSGSLDPGEGITYEFSFDSDDYEHTPATA